MRYIKFSVLTVAAALLLGAYAATALAAPEFKREGGGSVAGVKEKTSLKSGTTASLSTKELNGEVVKITCTAESGASEIESATTVHNTSVNYSGCTAKKGTKSCGEAHSPGANPGDISTVALKGRLGKVAKAEAKEEVGLLLEPESGTSFVTVEIEKVCPASTQVTGGVIGETVPTESFKSSGELVFAESSGKQKIRKFEGESSSHFLKAFGFAESVQVDTEVVSFEENGTPVNIEVTK